MMGLVPSGGQRGEGRDEDGQAWDRAPNNRNTHNPDLDVQVC